MPRPVELHPEALAEAEEATSWYARQNRRASAKLADELYAALEQIEQHPERWPRYLGGTRRLLLRRFPFQIVYRTDAARTLIVAVAHTSRRPGYWIGRD